MAATCPSSAGRWSATELRCLHIHLPKNAVQQRNVRPSNQRTSLKWPLHRTLRAQAGAAAALGEASTTTSYLAVPSEEEIAAIAASLTLSDLWKLMRPDWLIIAACATATLVSVASFVCVAPCLGRVIDVISGATSTPTQLSVAVGTLGAVYICSNLSLAAQVMLALAAGESLAARLRTRLFSTLLSRNAAFHDTARTGAMTAWLGQDVEVLQSTVAKLLGARGLRAVLETVGIVGALTWLSWPLALALLTAAPLVGPVVRAATRRIRGASQEAQATASAASAAADEIVENVRVVRAFGAERRQLQRYQTLADAAHAAARKVVGLQAVLDVSGRVRNTLCVLVTLSLGALLALTDRVSIGVCYSFFIYSFSFAFALSNVTATLGDLSKAAGTMARTLWVLRRCEMEDGDGHTADRAAQASGGRTLPVLRGEIEFRNVCFRHPSGWELREISFVIPAGATLALVGGSGGGKSTIASLLLGLYTPTSGEILVDGVPLHNLDLGWWRRQVGVVEQEPGLLTGVLRDIVAYGDPAASETEVDAALEDAQAAGFAAALPKGTSTLVGPGGVELSGGQRQRLALARALLGKPGIMVLDEATSALDVGTEAAVTEALWRRAGDGGRPTSLIIAHRLSTVRRADIIVVVQDGHMVEQGSHAELMAKVGGVYAGMVRRAVSTRQSGGDAVIELEVEEDGGSNGDGIPAEAVMDVVVGA